MSADMDEGPFWRKVWQDPDSGCWVWQGSIEAKGYGRFRFEGRWVKAHRWSYEWFVGPIPEGLTIDHLCRNRACVNPDHLEPVTNQENVRRGKAILTHCKNGHKFDEANTYLRPEGHRECRRCRSEQNRRYRRALSVSRSAGASSE